MHSTSEADGPRQTGLTPNRLREEKKYRVHLRPRNPSCPQLSELLTSKTPSGKTAERCAKDGTWFSTNSFVYLRLRDQNGIKGVHKNETANHNFINS